MIRLKDILLEGMTPEVADTIFSKFGVPNAAELDKGQLKNYYIALVKKHHPDVGGSDEEMKYINAAYDVLKDAEPRDTSGPADLWSGRTYPKGKGKARLQKIIVDFRLNESGQSIAIGTSDFYDLSQIIIHLKKDRIFFWLSPAHPYDHENEKWNTDRVVVAIGYDEGREPLNRLVAAVKKLKGHFY